MNIDPIQPEQQPGTALVPVAERAQLALSSTATEVSLRELATKHVNIQVIKDKAGREQAHGAAMELMRARTTISKVAKEARDDAVKFGKAVVAEEARLVAIIEPEETRLKGLRDNWDTEQARAKAEAERIERERLLALGARIQEIRGFARLAQDCRSSDAVRRLVERLAGLDMTGFAEFEAEAISVLTETRQQVEQVLNTRLATEAEAARLKAEREELARQQAETAERQRIESEKLAAERAEFARQQQEAEAKVRAAAEEMAQQRAEVERMRAELEAAKATIPAEVAPEKQALADAVHQIADIGIELADEVIVLTEQNIAIQIDPQEAAEISAGFDAAMTAPISIGIDMSADAPPAVSLINCVAEAYGVDTETACQWLCARADDFEAWVPAFADIA
jgi:hypothetical protein